MSRPVQMRASRFLMGIAVVVTLLGATDASAIDLCIDETDDGANPNYIVHKFRQPTPGSCRSFVGVYWPSFLYRETALHGVACVPRSPSVLNMTMTVGFMPSLPIGGPGFLTHVTVALNLPDLQGRYVVRPYSVCPSENDGPAAAYLCNSRTFTP